MGESESPRGVAGPAESEAVQDYAKAVYALQRRDGGPVATSALAERLGVSAGSVTAMLKRMAEMGLVRHRPYHGVELTPAGERAALEVMRHHRLLETYLADALDMPWDRVHEEAEVLEHYISEELEERLARALGHPSHDPHGDPIPSRELDVSDDESAVPLVDAPDGTRGTFGRVSDGDPEMLRFLAARGIVPGIAMTVKGRQPFGGPVMILAGEREHQIGHELARRMLLSVANA